MALSFASKCYTHLEIAHFKDNFKTLADQQDDVEFWKEETLCRFLALPDAIHAGSVVYAMTTYLGAFPFPSLAPCIVTREAMIRIITLMTDRYRKVLKRGDSDKNKLLFRSLAVFDRRASSALSPTSEKKMRDIIRQQQGEQTEEVGQTGSTGFSIDQPLDDDEDEDEDDDDLALAALDALDAIEVFKEDQKKDRKIHHAHIPVYNFERLIMLLLLFAPLTPQDNIAQLCGSPDLALLEMLETSAKALVTAFEPQNGCITYSNFVRTMTILTPQLFRPLNPLFEHFLFSKQMNLNKHEGAFDTSIPTTTSRSPIYATTENASPVMNDILLAQLNTSIEILTTVASASSSFFHAGARLNQIYSIATNGTSLSSFSRQVLSWESATILLLKGTDQGTNTTHVIGAYLPKKWKEGASSNDRDADPAKVRPTMFQLQPRHAIFRSNPYNTTIAISHFSSKTGISLGCIIPATSRVKAVSQEPVLGPVSLMIDDESSTATFQHDGGAGTGAYLTDPLLEEAQRSGSAQPKKIVLDIDAVEVWGIGFTTPGEDDEITKQKKNLAWEDAEAARRRGVNFGGDKEGARHLLEMAGIVGENSNNRSGGSV